MYQKSLSFPIYVVFLLIRTQQNLTIFGYNVTYPILLIFHRTVTTSFCLQRVRDFQEISIFSKGQIDYADIEKIIASCKIHSIIASFSRNPRKHYKNSNHGKHSFWTKIRRTKLPKIGLGAENFVRRKFLSAENFVRRIFVR